MRRHLATKKISGVRRVLPSGFRASVAEARKLKSQTRSTSIRSYSSPVERAVAAARAGQRAFKSKGGVKLRKEIGLDHVLTDMKTYVALLEGEKYKGNEARMIADWVKGDNLGGLCSSCRKAFW